MVVEFDHFAQARPEETREAGLTGPVTPCLSDDSGRDDKRVPVL